MPRLFGLLEDAGHAVGVLDAGSVRDRTRREPRLAVVPLEARLDHVAGFEGRDRPGEVGRFRLGCVGRPRVGGDSRCRPVGIRVGVGRVGVGGDRGTNRERPQVGVARGLGLRDGGRGRLEVDQQDRAVGAAIEHAKPAGRRRLHTPGWTATRISAVASVGLLGDAASFRRLPRDAATFRRLSGDAAGLGVQDRLDLRAGRDEGVALDRSFERRGGRAVGERITEAIVGQRDTPLGG